MSRQSFDPVAGGYDAARPDYPAGLYDAIESALGKPLLGADVVDIGAGTGIASRALAGRGARVIAVDPGPRVLAVLLARSTSRVAPVVGDGNALPLRSASFDLAAYAQSWHWADPARSLPEAARVLRDRGVLAIWWNVMLVEAERWWQDFGAAAERLNPGHHREWREFDCSASLERSGLFAWVHGIEVPWTRTVAPDGLVADYATHSYVAALAPPAQAELLEVLRTGLRAAYGGGPADLPYVTRLWIARR